MKHEVENKEEQNVNKASLFFGHFLKDVTFQLSRDLKESRGKSPVFSLVHLSGKVNLYTLFFSICIVMSTSMFSCVGSCNNENIIGLHFMMFTIIMILFVVHYVKKRKVFPCFCPCQPFTLFNFFEKGCVRQSFQTFSYGNFFIGCSFFNHFCLKCVKCVEKCVKEE